MSSAGNKQRIPAPGGEVILQSDRDRAAYDDWQYAPARRAGDFVYVSGVIVARLPDGPHTPQSFAVALRQTFAGLQVQLGAYGATLSDVVMIHTFHDWSAPEFDGDRRAQAEAFRAVKAEFMPPPHAAWTAVGTTGLIRPEGILEMELVAFSPVRG